MCNGLFHLCAPLPADDKALSRKLVSEDQTIASNSLDTLHAVSIFVSRQKKSGYPGGVASLPIACVFSGGVLVFRLIIICVYIP